jgi:hypothetical protein
MPIGQADAFGSPTSEPLTGSTVVAASYLQTPRARATGVGTPLIGQRKLLPTATNRQPRECLCSMITPLAATRLHARDSFLGHLREAYV